MSDKAEMMTVERGREMFVAVVAAQDEGLSVWDSRELIARRFGVDVEMVRGARGQVAPVREGISRR